MRTRKLSLLDFGCRLGQQLSGGFDFLWSHNRQFVAHHIPFYNEENGSVLGIGEQLPLYPKPDAKTGRIPVVDIGELAWSPDDKWVSFSETDYPSYDGYVVLVSPQGDVLRESVPVDVDGAKVVWTDKTHLEIETSRRKVKFLVDQNGLHELRAR